MKGFVFVASIAVLLTGCANRVCRSCDTSRSEPYRRFVVLSANPLTDPKGGPAQVFVDSRVVAVPANARVPALEAASRVVGEATPVWIASGDVSTESFGSGATVVALPKVLASDGNDVTVSVGDANRDGSTHSGWWLGLTPTIRSDQVRMTVAYRHHEASRIVDYVPETAVEGPPGRTFVIEARPN